jgi:hypothetical protein
VEAVEIRRFLKGVRLATNLFEVGAVPARLQLDPGVLDALGIPGPEQHRLSSVAVQQQLDTLRPYVTAYLAREKRTHLDSAATAAHGYAEELRRSATPNGADTKLQAAALASLAAVPAYRVLQIERGGSPPWAYGRATLCSILRSLKACSNVTVRLDEGRVLISYISEGSGNGMFTLPTQAVPAWQPDILRVSLPASPKPHAASPTTPMREPRRQPVPAAQPSGSWLVDAAYALLDGLLAG